MTSISTFAPFGSVIESESFGSQNRCDIIQHAACLRGDVAGDNLARFGVERNLAAAKEEPSATHRLRVGADRRWSFAGGNDFLHAGDCSCKNISHNVHKGHRATRFQISVSVVAFVRVIDSEGIWSILRLEWLGGF